MDEQVINDLYQRAQSNGYAKSREEFIKLLHSDNDVFNDMFSYVKGKGYQKNENDFSTLIGKTVGPDLEQSKKKRLIEIQKPSTELPLEDGSLASQKLNKVEKAVEVPDDYKRINALSNKYTPVVSLDKEGKTVYTKNPEGLVEIDLFPEFTANKKKDPIVMREAASRLRVNIEEKINDINTGKKKVHYLSDTKDKLEKDLNEVKALQIKANKEVWALDDAEYEEMVATARVDQSGSIAKKAFNRVMAAISPYKSIQLMSNEISYNQINLKPEFSLGMKVLSGIEPVEYERVLSALKNNEPISSTDIANITAYGLDIKDERLKKEQKKIEDKYSSQLGLLKNDIQKYESAINNKKTLSESDIADYNSKITNYNTILKEINPLQEKSENLRKAKEDNLLNSPEVLRAFISEDVAERLNNLKKGINPDFKSEFLFGHTWNYTDDEIKFAAEEGLKKFGIDPNDKRVVAAIKYLQDNEGVWLFQNSIAKSGGIRELGKGVSGVVSGMSNFVENLPKSEYEIYAEAKSAGSVNVAEKRLKEQDEGVIGVANDVLKGVGQFGAQAGIMYLTGGAIGAGGKAILGRAGTAALAGDIAIADMSVGNLIGSTLLKAKNPLSVLTTTYAMEYDSNLKQALSYTSDNSLARNAAALNTAISSATELILSPLDIAKGIVKKFSKGETKDLLNILSDKSLKNDPSKLKNYITKAIKGVGGAGKVVVAEILEEEVVAVTDYLTNQYLNPESESFQNRKLSSEMAEVAYQTGVSMALPAMLNGVGAANANTFSKSAILVASQNRLKMIEGLGVSLANKNISKEEYAEQVQLVNISAKANDEMPNKADGIKLNADEKANYIWSRVTESFMNDKMKATDDEAQKMILKKKIAEQQNYRAKILGGEEILVKPSYKVDDNEVSKDEFISLMDSEGSDRFRFEVTGDSEMKDKLRSEAGLQQEEAPEVTSKRTDRIAEIEFALSPESTIVIEDAEKTKLQTELETLKTEQDAIQKQATDAGVLRTEEPEVGLQQVGEGNKFEAAKGIKEATIENEKPKILSTVEETLGALNTLPTEEKTNYTFTNEKGEEVPLNTNEKVAAELFHQAIAVPEEERTASQQSAVDAIEVSLKTQIDEQKIEKQKTPVVNVAPFFDTQVTNKAEAASLRTTPEYQGFIKGLNDLAVSMGLTSQITDKIGGYKNNDGNDITEVSALVSLPGATIEQAEQFAALSAALTPDVQESSIAAKYTGRGEQNHNANEYEFRTDDVDGAIKALKEAGIKNFTADDQTGIITFTDVKEFADKELTDKIEKMLSLLNKRNIYYDTESIKYRPVESRFIDKDRRKDVLRQVGERRSDLGQGGGSLREAFERAVEKDAIFQGITAEEYRGSEQPSEPVAGNRLFNKPFKAVTEIANRYYERIFGKQRPEYYGSRGLNQEQSNRISDAYDNLKNDPFNPEVRKAYEALAKETIEQFKALTDAGFTVEINNDDPYANSQEMIEDLRNNNRIKIFSTESGFGDTPITEQQRVENPLLAKSEYVDSNGVPLLVNDLFRAIHDFFGHAELGNSFGPKGEENAWNVHVRMFSPEAARAMTTETRGQNSYVNSSGINKIVEPLREKARKLRKEGKFEEAGVVVNEIYQIMKFADQKIGLLPEEFSRFDVNDKGDESMRKVNAPSELDNVLADKTNLTKAYNLLDSIDKGIDKFLKSGPNSVTTVIPLGTMKIIVKALKALVKGGMMLQDAIKKVAADNNVKEADIISSLTIINSTEANVPEGLSEGDLPGFDRMMEQVEGIVQKSKDKGVDETKIKDNVMQYVMKSKVYETASDIQREKLVREVNKMFGVREKSAPSVGRILGTIKDINKITMSEKDALKKQLKDYNKGANNATAAWAKASTDLTKAIKEMANSGKLTIKQVANVLRKFSSVNMFKEGSIDNFVDYMSNVFQDAEYADKINTIKKKLPTARKNVKTKLGAAMNLIPSMERLFSINPDLIPSSALDSYILLVDMMGKRQETLDLIEINVATRMTNTVLDAVDEEQSKAEELSDRFDWYSDPVLNDDGSINYADTIKAMLKDGTITEEDAELMRKYKSTIMPRPEKAEMTEQEIEDEKQALIDSLNNITLDPSKMASIDDRRKAISLKELLKTEAIKKLNAQQLKKLIKVVNAINNGYFPHSAQLVIERLNAINNAISLVNAVQVAKPLPVTNVYTRIKKLFTDIYSDKGKTPIQEMVIRSPLYFIDQVFGDFKTKRIFNAIFEKAAQGQSAYDAQLNKINRQVDNARNAVAKSFGMNPNKTIMSSYKMMSYMIQNEYLSNPDSNQVNPAHKYLAETIKFLENDNRDAQANMLQDILDNYTDTDGNIDANKLYNSFNKAEREALKVIREINDGLTDKAIHTAGVIRGQKISPLNNYVHMPVISDFDTQNTTSITAAADAYNRALMPSTKGKSLIERDGKVHPLNFDVFASVQQGSKSVLMDYNLTEPIRTARKTLAEAEKMMAESGRISKEKRQIFSAIKKSFNQATEDLLLNNYIATSFGDDVMNFITKQGYRAILASAPRFITELISNVGYAVISDPRSFTTGLSYQGLLMTPSAVDVVNNVSSKQIIRLFHGDALSGRFIDTGILSQKTGVKAGKPKGAVRNIAEMVYNRSLKKYKNAIELTADTLISTPDKLVMRPIWFGAFANKFESITGTKVDFEKIAANDESYMNQHKAAIEQATTTADDKSVLAGATDNAYMGILKGKSPNQSATLKVFNNFNNFMTRFAIYEYTAARTGVYAMVGNGSISKKDGAALLAGVTTRMMVYSMLTHYLGTLMLSMFSDEPPEEEEDEKTFMQKFGQAFTSTATGMLLGRDFGNATRGIINYGLEEMNEKFLTGLRNGEYDPYKDAISYSIMPKEKKGQKTNLSDFITVMGGSMGPALKTLDLTIRKIYEAPKKEAGAIQRQRDEIEKRIPLEIAGNLGFIPLYKDVRKVIVNNIYSSLREEQKADKIKKQEKEAEDYLKSSEKIEVLEKLQKRTFNNKMKEEIKKQINILSMSEEDKKEYDKENEGLKELKKSEYKALLGIYDNQSDMEKYDKTLWLKTFGPNSSYYKENKIENEVEKMLRKELILKKDKEYNYRAPMKKKW